MLKTLATLAGAATLAASAPMAQANDNPHLYPPEGQTVEQACAKTDCRKGGFEVVTWLNETRYITLPVSASPYILADSSILIFPGETIAIQFSIIDGKPALPRLLKRFAPHFPAEIGTEKIAINPDDAALPKLPEDWPDETMPPNTLVLSYGQLGHKSAMYMDLMSNLPQPVKADAMLSLVRAGGYEWHATSTCPIGPKMGSSEMWPETLGPMTLSNIRFIPAKETVCR